MKLKNLVLLAGAIGAIVWYANDRSKSDASSFVPQIEAVASPSNTIGFRCEGKTHCSQMNSCDEATFYIKHCPGTAMDGDGDGVPCESQWCGRE